MTQSTNKSGLRVAGETLILIGAIIGTIIQALLIFATFFIWTIPAILFIVFLWVTRAKVLDSGSRGWNIFGIVLCAMTDTVGLIGYILLLVDNDLKAKYNFELAEQAASPDYADYEDENYEDGE